MTLSMAWIRNVGPHEQLVFASDSRLRFGQAWDCCPKVFTLPRTDCLASFAGSTWYAYPLLLQLRNTIASHPPSRRREIDVSITKGHVLRMFNQMRGLIHDFPVGVDGPEDPEALFLFGGYSTQQRRFVIWVIRYQRTEDRFIYGTVAPWEGEGQQKTVMFVGDAVPEAKQRLRELLESHGRLRDGGLDMEPLEVLRDMIMADSHPTIGGPPQVAKVFVNLNSTEFAVRWPPDGGELTVCGRPALSYERFDVPVLDITAPGTEESYMAQPAMSVAPEDLDEAHDLESAVEASTQ